jgi:hypothetical protein
MGNAWAIDSIQFAMLSDYEDDMRKAYRKRHVFVVFGLHGFSMLV